MAESMMAVAYDVGREETSLLPLLPQTTEQVTVAPEPEQELMDAVMGLAPVCPYCGCTPAKVQSSMVQIGPIQACVFCCGEPDCRKIFNVSFVGVVAPPIVRADPGALLGLSNHNPNGRMKPGWGR